MLDTETRELFELLHGIQDGLAARVAAKMDAARVLELSEIPTHDGAVLLDYVRSGRDICGEWALYVCERGNTMAFTTTERLRYELPVDEYGVTWRAWTKRPTDARWMVEPWKSDEQNSSRARAEKLMHELSELGSQLMTMTREVADILQAIDEEGEDE